MHETSLQEEKKAFPKGAWHQAGSAQALLESACPWTVRLLRMLGRLEHEISSLHARQNSPAYVEKSGEQFLFAMSASPEPLVSATARMELAVMRVRQGSTDEYLIEWDRSPELVFQALHAGRDLPQPEPATRFRMYVSRDIPGMIRCERMVPASAQT